MYITPDNRQIQSALEKRRRSLISAVVSLVAAAVMFGVCAAAWYAGLHAEFYGDCVLCGSAMAGVVLAIRAVPRAKAAAADIGGLVAADTYISLENHVFSARDIYKNMYESCSILCSDIEAVAVPDGRERRFYIKVRDGADGSCIFADDLPLGERVFLVDGQKYDPVEFGKALAGVLDEMPGHASRHGIPDMLPDWPVKRRGMAAAAASCVAVAAAAAAPELLDLLAGRI
ncbi:MAG: hypothetical protein LUE14_08680 [Clostridiales bacterium]|nr:hypothetical protein [Clostridiales bacterium]